MTENRSEKLISALSFTALLPTSFKEKLFEVFQMTFAWNKHMKDLLIPLWVFCLYYSIYICTDKFTCPGCIFVPRNPHPKVNKNHTIR